MEAGQPAQLTGTNRSMRLSARIQRQGSSCQMTSDPEAGAQGGRPFSRRQPPPPKTPTQLASAHGARASRPGDQHGRGSPDRRWRPWAQLGILDRPGGHSEGQNTRSHPELGRENPQRRWYCVSRRGRVGRAPRPAARTRFQVSGTRYQGRRQTPPLTKMPTQLASVRCAGTGFRYPDPWFPTPDPRQSLVAIARGKTPDPIPNSAVKTLSADGTAS